jgi:hypothetical protein
MKKGIHLALALITLFLLMTCLSCSSHSASDPAAPAVQTISWQPDSNGFLQYSTNDPNLYDTGHIHTNNTIQATMSSGDSVEAEVIKNSGSAHMGYGILFCYQSLSNYYKVDITINGDYMIIKRVSGISYYYSNGSWVTTNPSWPISSNLITGYGNSNDIKVVNAGGGTFDVYFNGNLETTFTDSTFTGGDSGYLAAIDSAANENFPATPNDTRFKQITPDLSTASIIQTILWQSDGSGFIQFLTNDTNYCGDGWFDWTSASYTPMNSVEMQVKKIAGDLDCGNGIIFCVQDDNNFYRIVVTATGYYLISKKVAGTYSFYWGSGVWATTEPYPWPTSSNLITGYGNINDIKVVNAGGGTFDVYFNSELETTFTDSTFTGGHNGYYAFVSTVSLEGFPTPMDFRVKLIFAH